MILKSILLGLLFYFQRSNESINLTLVALHRSALAIQISSQIISS